MTEDNKNTENANEVKSDSVHDFKGIKRSEKNTLTWWEKLLQGSYNSEQCRIICEFNVVRAFQRNPLLRVLKGALESAGCPLDLKRHIVCEDCSKKVQGGYDYEFNQVVVCKNWPKVRDQPDAILIHELIHMYDHCVNEVNFKNLEHLACTEIRAANIAHCSFLSSVVMGHSSPINIKETHQYCVKTRAAQSLSVARDIEFHTAVKYVFKVFNKCYNDLEPIGRRVRRKSEESYMAEEEAKCFLIAN